MRLKHKVQHRLRRSFDVGVHRFASLAYRFVPAADPSRYGVSILRDLPYLPTRSRAHLLDVYRPNVAASVPAVLYLHGGAFSMLSKDTHRVMALALASRGYTVFNINYRLGPEHLYPAQLEDAASALHWMLDNAERHGADPSRVVLAGESAGANLVTALAYVATHPRPEPFARAVFERSPSLRAVLAIYGFLDLTDLGRFLSKPKVPGWAKAEIVGAAAAYVGRPVHAGAVRAPLASPLKLLEEPAPDDARPLPPFFAAVGTADPLLDDSRRLERAIAARGGTCELSIHPGEIHGFNAMVWRPEARAKWRAAYDFLGRYA